MALIHHDPNLSGAMDYVMQAASHPIAVASTALAGVTTPWWLEYLRESSDTAAIALPILGCVLATLQIIAIIARWLKSG